MLTWIKSHKAIFVIIVAILAFGLYRYFTSTKVSYTEYTVTQQRVQETLELSGKVAAGRSATLRFSAGGLVTYLGAKEGDQIKQWQTLASLDTRQLHKQLEQKLNLYALQRATFDQTVDDNDNSVPSGDLERTLERLLAKNQYQLDNTVKDVEYGQLALQLSRISSPIAGVLVHAPIDTANVQVGATDSWLVVDPTSLYFTADLDETDLRRVEIGQKVEISLDAYPDETLASKITSIAYAPTQTTTGTTYELKLGLPAGQLSRLRLGLNGTATIILTAKDSALTLPSKALTFQGDTPQVLVKSGNKYELKSIKLGIENAGVAEVVSGLGEGEHVYIQN